MLIPATGGAQVRDSLLRRGECFGWSQLAAPAVLGAAGASFLVFPQLHDKVNVPVQDYIQGLPGNAYVGVDEWIQYLPMTAYLGLGFAARCDHGFIERSLITATSFVAMASMVEGAKLITRELRPDGSDYKSFPSGHAARAFMGAELMRREYGPLWGAGAYAVATGTAFLRIWNDRHWTGDVLAGATAGILGAEIGYWLMPLERRILGLEGKKAAVAVMPSPWGVSLACQF